MNSPTLTPVKRKVEVTSTATPPNTGEPEKRPKLAVLEDREHYSDLTLRFSDGDGDGEVNVHKYQMIAASGYIKRALTGFTDHNDTTEDIITLIHKDDSGNVEAITFTDDDPGALRTVIDFAYVQDHHERKIYLAALPGGGNATEIAMALVVANKYECASICKALTYFLIMAIQDISKQEDDEIDVKDFLKAVDVTYSVDAPALSSAQKAFAGLITSKLSFLLEDRTKKTLLALFRNRSELAVHFAEAHDCKTLNVSRHRLMCPYCKYTHMHFAPEMPVEEFFCSKCGRPASMPR